MIRRAAHHRLAGTLAAVPAVATRCAGVQEAAPTVPVAPIAPNAAAADEAG